ncbi:MAG: DUF2809 domain-containing protein [Lachnospiraceae bacterium]|nr:DUF2809 domain-containing protein [Lachnospiraceae bacterium]
MARSRKRLFYAIVFFLLLFIEVLIALFVHDRFVRPYVGDMIVVVVVYCFVRIVIPERFRLMPLWVFLFAVCVEVLQYFRIVEVLGVENNAFLRTLIGTSFAWEDILCYAVGCAVLVVWEVYLWKKK